MEGCADTGSFEPRLQMTPELRPTKLLRAARHGDRDARARLVTMHIALVHGVARRYCDFGLPLDDLVQEGSLGLLEAIDDFDPARGVDFETYARFRVRRAIRNALTNQSRLIRLPKQIVERRRVLDRAEARFVAAQGRPPTNVELAVATGLTAEAVVDARRVASAGVSLDRSILPDGSAFDSLVPDAAATDPELEAVEREQAQLVDDAVAHLPMRQREIVSRHFGLGQASERMAEVAAGLHVSQQRARAIERAALCTLREQLEDQSSSLSRR
jgi:RNA polymerase sigma factor (sigma-70 family)